MKHIVMGLIALVANHVRLETDDPVQADFANLLTAGAVLTLVTNLTTAQAGAPTEETTL